MSVKAKFRRRIPLAQPANDLGNFLRTRPTRGVTHHQSAHLLLHALAHQVVKILQALRVEFRLCRNAKLAPSATRVHRVLQVHNHFQSVILQAGNRFACHQQMLFRRRLQALAHIQQPRLHHHHTHRNTSPVLQHKLHIGPILHPGSAAPRTPEQSQLHRARIHIGQGFRQLAYKLVRARKTNLGIAHAKGRHPLQQAHSVRCGNLQVRLLQPITQAGIKQLCGASLSLGQGSKLLPRAAQAVATGET